ncbi:hypothetical protein Lal_00043759 [Lupinus albus]|nr:hypothetical protein Lal_00043759 [Lupinus albus]
MQQMLNFRDSQSMLPYAIFITKILEHFRVSLDGETKETLNLRESNNIEVVHVRHLQDKKKPILWFDSLPTDKENLSFGVAPAKNLVLYLSLSLTLSEDTLNLLVI